MIVINATMPPRPLVIGIPAGLTAVGTMQYVPTVLKPGTNEVPETRVFEESLTARDWVQRKWVDVKRPKATKDGAESPGLLGFAPDMAQAMIEQCFDTALLQRFNALETRGEVKASIVERLQAIRNTEQDRDNE